MIKKIEATVAAAQRVVLKMGMQSMEEQAPLSLEQSQWLDFVFTQVGHFHSCYLFV